MARDDQTVQVEGRRLRLTNLEKVLYPETGTTKAHVLAYYAEIAPVILPHLDGRPITRKRWVHGVGTEDSPGDVFFQKNLDDATPEWVARGTIQHRDHENAYPIAAEPATLAWLAQIASLELHVPQWRFAADGSPANPDRLVIDLDPGPGAGLPECVEVARIARGILRDVGLEPVPVTSGSKGVHLYAKLDGAMTSAQASAFAKELARAIEADHPDLAVSDMKKSLRQGRVLVDWSQNSGAKTTVSPYSLRGRLRPTVAAPRTWRELLSPQLRQLELDEVLQRVRRRGDPAEAVAPVPPDRLAAYRSMRDATRTSEPVPDRHGRGGGREFVIQEHHARRLHWDFRLERDGVLVSWALPKGVPTDGRRNHLAVPTEDHPVEYGAFEGTIPKGEYGAGEVSIWDSGRYDLEKWRDDEVIATLHGRADGGLGGEPTRLALIRTGKDWLIHRMQDQPDASSRPPRIAPMLATKGSLDELDGEDWLLEGKWDGYRAIVTIEDGRARLRSRTDQDLGRSFPELRALARQVRAERAVLDGEIVVLDARGRPSFRALQQRLQGGSDGRLRFIAFDLLWVDGRDLQREPYATRRGLLAETIVSGALLEAPESLGADPVAALAVAEDLGLEGIVAKAPGSRYRPGRRSSDWRKITRERTAEVVVAGWREGTASLLLAVPDGDGWRYAGRVGSGLGDAELDRIVDRLQRMERATAPVDGVPTADARDARWARLELVAEIAFAERTDGGRFRQPRWRGLRPDKTTADVNPE
jgi:bifunctional non-homologous end joining protein LigD